MRKHLLAVVVSLCSVAALAQTVSWPDGYWERQYGYGQQWSVMYMVSLKVGSPADAREKAVKLLEQAGGRPSQGGFYGGNPRPGQSQQVGYFVPVEKAEKAAKRLLALGDLQQFSTQRTGFATQLPEVREKIAALEGEQKSNAAALAVMPISRTLLASHLTKLTQARDSFEASAGTALINLTLMDASAPEAANPVRYKQAVPVSPMLASEGAAKGSLGALRSALSIYYGDTEGRYPSTLSDLTVGGKYLTKIPRIKVASHAETDVVTTLREVADMASLKTKLKDTGGWAYVADPKSSMFGTVVVDCTHVDSRAMAWFNY